MTGSSIPVLRSVAGHADVAEGEVGLGHGAVAGEVSGVHDESRGAGEAPPQRGIPGSGGVASHTVVQGIEVGG